LVALVLALISFGATFTYQNSQSAYYITKTGTKYHTKDCEYILGHKLTKIQKQDAERLGYEPCLGCIKNK